MKRWSIVLLVLLIACTNDDELSRRKIDEQEIRHQIEAYHQGLTRAFRGEAVDTDQIMDALFDESVYYVTYWGVSEPLDSTKTRLERAIPLISDYASRLEIVSVEVSGDFAYAFFIVRQSYRLGGERDEYLPTTFVFRRIDENWKVVHAHRSADRETIVNMLNASDEVVTSDTVEQSGNR